MMAAKIPAPKIMASAIFSCRGRLNPFKVLIGRAMIQKSVMILTPEVAIKGSVLIHTRYARNIDGGVQ